MNNGDPIIFSKSEHLFFDELVHFVLYTSALGAFVHGTYPFTKPEDSFILEGSEDASNQMIKFFPFEIITNLRKGSLPERIKAYTYTLIPDWETKLFAKPMKGPNTRPLQHVALMPLFVMFFEKGKARFQEAYGKPKEWPADNAWAFGQVIRNSFVHFNGRIFLDRGRPVKWRNIEYTKASTENNPRFLFTDLGLADVIFLMIDMNNEIKGLLLS